MHTPLPGTCCSYHGCTYIDIVSLCYQGGLCHCSAQVPYIALGGYRMYCTTSSAVSSAQAGVVAHVTRHGDAADES